MNNIENEEHILIMTVADISNRLNVSKYTVCKWIRDGSLKARLKEKGKRRSGYVITSKALMDFLKRNPQYSENRIMPNNVHIFRMLEKRLLSIEADHIADEMNHDKSYNDGWHDAITRVFESVNDFYNEHV